jgi:hypothetical protein
MLPLKSLRTEKNIKLLYYSIVGIIALFSFLVYSPMFHPYFNSDHAVHVLISYRFDYPEGLFFWGQNRLGSLLPIITHGFVKYLGIHPLFAISVINHLFLLIAFLILSIPIRNHGYKLILCVFLFFPLYTYNALLLVGHPYCSQLFAGTVAIYFFYKLYQYALEENNTLKNWRPWFFSLIGSFMLVVSIWVSELSYIFGMFVLIFIVTNFTLLKILKSIFLKEKILSVVFVILNVANLDMWFKKYGKYKGYFPKDELYDQVFLKKASEVQQQKVWMQEKITAGLNFSGEDTTYSWFYWSLIGIFLLSVIYFKSSRIKSPLNLAMMGTILIGVVLLFFSTWNFRSEYEPRYYTIIIVLIVAGLLYLSAELIPKKIGWAVTSLWLVATLAILKNNSNVVFPLKENVREKYGEFANLPKGGLIGGYWHAYQINAVCPYNIKSIPIHNDAQRNKHMIWEVLDEPILYVIKNDFLDMSQPMPDTLDQFDIKLIKIQKEEKQIGDVTYGVYTKMK